MDGHHLFSVICLMSGQSKPAEDENVSLSYRILSLWGLLSMLKACEVKVTLLSPISPDSRQLVVATCKISFHLRCPS